MVIIVRDEFGDLSSNLDVPVCFSRNANHIYQPLRSGRIWLKIIYF